MNDRDITIDDNLFNKIYADYSKLIFSVCYHILLSKAEAEEAVQEVFIRFSQNYKTIEKPKYWLVKVANNYCNEQYNRKKCHQNYLARTMNHAKTLMKTMTMFFSNSDELQKVFICLDKKERFLLTLKIGYDYKHEEIAEILEVPVGTVKSSLSRLLKKIKGEL